MTDKKHVPTNDTLPALMRYRADTPNGPLILNEKKQTVSLNKTIIKLQHKQFELLSLFMANPTELLTANTIGIHLGSNIDVVRNTINKLRLKLVDNDKVLIKTEKGGYRFTLNVEANEIEAGIRNQLNRLKRGVHCPPAKGYLAEKAYHNHGIECWTIKTNDSRPPDYISRIAVSQLGERRLKREALVYLHIIAKLPNQTLVKIPESSPPMPDSLALRWPASLKSLKEMVTNDAFLIDHRLYERVALVAEVTRKVIALHDIGIIHGDIKPSTILYDTSSRSGNLDDRLFLAGLSHAVVDERHTTSVNVPPLPPLQEVDWRRRRPDSDFHRAPELISQEKIDRMSDVYALGVLLYRIAVGDMEAPFTANWQQQVHDATARNIIEGATATAVENRMQIKSLYNDLTHFQELREEKLQAEHSLRALKKYAEEKKQEATKRPWKQALTASLFISLISLSALSISLFHSRNKAQEHLLSSQMTQSFLQKILLSADPRTPSNGPNESVREVVYRASRDVETVYAGHPQQQISTLILLSNIQRGFSDFTGQRISLERAITILKQEFPDDTQRLAQLHYQLAHNLLLGKPREDETAESIRLLAKQSIDDGDLIVNRSGLVDHAIAVSAAYAKSRYASEVGDYKTSESYLAKAITRMRAGAITPTRNNYNTVINYAQAQLRNGEAEQAYNTLEWLASMDQRSDIPVWLQLNRRTLSAQIAGTLNLPNTEKQFQTALTDLIEVYGVNDTREGVLRSYYSNYLSTVGQLNTALVEQQQAHEIFCGNNLGPLYCKGTLASIGAIKVQIGEYTAAIKDLKDAASTFTKVHPAGVMLTNYYLAAASIGLSKPKDAREYVTNLDPKVLESVAPGGAWPDTLAVLFAALGALENKTPSNLQKLQQAIKAYEINGGIRSAIEWATAIVN
jgi:serine/threonine protein kinase/DNA-binding winged helix-turn-helix (wHTH) protein